MGLWRKIVRWLVQKDAVIQKKPIPKAVNEKTKKVMDKIVT